MPLGGGNSFEGLLSGGQPDESNLQSAIPRLLYKTQAGTMRSIATANEYMGNDTAVKRQISMAAAEPVDFVADNSIDPRMIEPLPWASGSWRDSVPGSVLSNQLHMVTNALLIFLGALVFPFFYVRYMARRKRWTLQSFMLLPLLFAIPYLVLQLPLETKSGNQSADIMVNMFGVQPWVGKLMVVSMVLPTVIFAVTCIKYLWRGNWKRLIGLSITAIVISIGIGVLWLLVASPQFPTGCQYDWYDWGTVRLILYGSWYVGLGIILQWIFVSTGRVLIRIKKRVSSLPGLATT